MGVFCIYMYNFVDSNEVASFIYVVRVRDENALVKLYFV